MASTGVELATTPLQLPLQPPSDSENQHFMPVSPQPPLSSSAPFAVSPFAESSATLTSLAFAQANSAVYADAATVASPATARIQQPAMPHPTSHEPFAVDGEMQAQWQIQQSVLEQQARLRLRLQQQLANQQRFLQNPEATFAQQTGSGGPVAAQSLLSLAAAANLPPTA